MESMTPWLPGYEHDPEPGAGLSVTAGAPKVVLHTTESPRGSWHQIRNLWRGSGAWGRGLPHFLADGTRYVQLLPLDVGCYTLENRPGPPDTNRSGPAIQVEICGYAQDAFDDDEYEAMGKWLADLIRAGVSLDLSQHPRFYGAGEGITLASYSSPIRNLDWERFNGFCGHQHVAENAHWDPGHLDGDRVEHIARQHLSGATTPIPKERPVSFVVVDARNGLVAWLVSGFEKRKLSNQPVDFPAIFANGIKSGELKDCVDYGLRTHGSSVIAWLDHCREVTA